MSDKSIIIIGAGLAGLSAGCYAQMNGFETRIFEHADEPGGVAASWKRGDYYIDGGIHFLMGHKPRHPYYQLYRELGADNVGTFIDMTDYGRVIDEASNRTIDLAGDLDELRDRLKALSPPDSQQTDGQIVDKLISGGRAFIDPGPWAGMIETPPELLGRVGRLKQMWGMRGAMRYMGGVYRQPMSEFAKSVQDPMLRRILENLFLPEVPVWFVLMLLGMLSAGTMGLIPVGSRQFAGAIEKRYRELGGKIEYKSTVEKILVEDDRVEGVQLAEGGKQEADIVISAADGFSTIYQMLDGRYVDREIDRRYREWPMFKPWVMASYGVAREFKDEPRFQAIFLAEPFEAGGQDVDWLTVRIFNYSPGFAPRGKTVVQVSFETDWEYWNTLREDRSAYTAEKERAAAAILTKLEPHFPGLSSQVEVTDVATPYTTWRYTLNREGAYEGWIPTHEAMMSPVKRTLPGLRKFYMAGQWVSPGGGVAPVMYSGRQAIQVICHEEGKRFRTA